MARVIWLDGAINDLNGIIGYIEQFDVSAALKMQARLVALGDSPADYPRRGRPAGDARELVTEPPYILRYRVEDETVLIDSLRHGRRRPPA